MSIPLIDLKAQFNEVGAQVRRRIDDVLAHGQFATGMHALRIFTSTRTSLHTHVDQHSSTHTNVQIWAYGSLYLQANMQRSRTHIF